MQIPLYSLKEELKPLPTVGQKVKTSASDFINPQAALGLASITQLAGQAQDEQERQTKEAEAYRVDDAINQLQSFALESQTGKEGWIHQQGAAVFQSDDGGKALSDRELEKFDKEQNRLSMTLGSERQKQSFSLRGTDIRLKIQERLMGHESDQYRVYQRNVNTATMASEANNIGFNNNDIDAIHQSIDKIYEAGGKLGVIEGQGEELGKMGAKEIVSKALMQGISLSLQQGRTSNAKLLLDEFGGQFDAKQTADIQNLIQSSYASQEAVNNPEGLINAIQGHQPGGAVAVVNEDTINQFIQAIKQQESGGRGDFNKDGSPLVSFDGESLYEMQTTHKTARDPGFGIRPAQSQTAKEYNRVGTQLIHVYMDRYQGDPEKMAAAFNAGAGAVDNAIKRGGDNWRNFIPKSTKETYVPNILKNFTAEGNPYVAMMSNEDKATWINKSKGEISKKQSLFATQLEQNKKNQYAQIELTGISGPLISEASFLSIGKPEHYADYLDNIKFYQQMHSLKNMPLDEIDKIISAEKPAAGTPDFAREAAQFEKLGDLRNHMKIAFDAITKVRNADPITWAIGAGYPVKPLTPGNLAASEQELTNRHLLALELDQKFKTPYQVLSHNEKIDLTKTLNDGSEDEKIKVLKMLANGIKDSRGYQETVRQLTPDSGALLVAGQLYGHDRLESGRYFWQSDKTITGESVARTIIRGDSYLHPGPESKGTGISLPSKLNEAFYTEIAGAFDGHIDLEQITLSAMRAYYAGKMDRTGGESGEVTDALLTESVAAITGGLLTHAGEKVLPPFAMSQKDFDTEGERQFLEQTGDELSGEFQSFRVRLLDKNRYYLIDGNRPFVYNGNPVILDFNP